MQSPANFRESSHTQRFARPRRLSGAAVWFQAWNGEARQVSPATCKHAQSSLFFAATEIDKSPSRLYATGTKHSSIPPSKEFHYDTTGQNQPSSILPRQD